MANAKVCDLCGKFYILNNPETQYVLYKRSVIVDVAYDTCPECDHKLEIFIKSIKEKNNAEN